MQKRRGNPGGELLCTLGGAAHQRGAGLRRCLFTGCPLRCLFCQNGEISAGENLGKAFSPEELNGLFLSLEEQGPTTSIWLRPPILRRVSRKALLLRRPEVPVVYNTSGYERWRRCGHWRAWCRFTCPILNMQKAGWPESCPRLRTAGNRSGRNRGDGAADGSPRL